MANVSTHPTLTTNLISYWELEETSGTRNDSHGSNHLTDNNTVTSGTGQVGTAAFFTSANSEYLSITDAAQTGLDITTTGSWAYWIKFNTDTDAVVLAKYSTGQQGYWLQHQVGTSQRFTNSAEIAMDVTATMNTGTWYFCVWTYNSGTATFYLNGTSQGSATNGTSLTNTTAPFELGRINKYNSNYVDGLMDQVGVWSKVLSGTEITDLYNGGAGLSYSGGGSTFVPRVSFIM